MVIELDPDAGIYIPNVDNTFSLV